MSPRLQQNRHGSDPLRHRVLFIKRRVPAVYFDATTALGRAIAQRRWELVYGGNAVGLMEALADSVRAAGGRVVGITPQTLVDKGISDTACDELIVTSGMRERKALLEAQGDAFIALPGGLGTFEEIFEIIVGRELGYHRKPIVMLNIAGYYGPLLAMLEHGIEQQFIKPTAQDAFYCAGTVKDAMEWLDAGITPPVPSLDPSAAE